MGVIFKHNIIPELYYQHKNKLVHVFIDYSICDGGNIFELETLGRASKVIWCMGP